MSRAALIFLVLLLACFPRSAEAGERIALLIGNKNYAASVGALNNPLKDVDLLAKVLKRLGFQVMPVLKDASRAQILDAIYDYTQALKAAGPKAVGFFYYSGHGLAVGGKNYIVPINADAMTARALRRKGLPLDDVTGDLAASASNADHFVVFDACRNVRSLKGAKGFVPVQQRSGMFIAFSTRPGATASDGQPDDPAGPYAMALAEELQQPGLHNGDIFQNVRQKVAGRTSDQVPLELNGLFRRIYFTKKLEGPCQEAGRLWRQDVRNSQSRAVLSVFINRFPNCIHAEFAKGRLKELEQMAALGKLQKPTAPESPMKPAVGVFEEKRLSFEPEMVRIPGGTFSMGCVSGKDCYGDDKPVHKVTVSGFEIGKYEVTVGQFRAFVDDTGYTVGKCNWPKGKSWRNPGFKQSDDQPVVCVSWNDAVAYAKWLSGKTGKKYRLPTEAEWEYAARGDRSGKNRTIYSWGNEIGRNKANCDSDCGDRFKNTAPVGRFGANGFELHDMHGNVLEWVADWYGKYGKGHQTDPRGPKSGQNRVYRGGGWSGGARSLRSAIRYYDSPGDRGYNLGFRLARTYD